MKCDDVKRAIHGELPMLFSCVEEHGRLKIATPYLYPNGDYVDLYLVETPTGRYLTDLGETMGYLADHNITLERSPKRRKIVEDVLLTQGVERFLGELRVKLTNEDRVAWAIARLGQAMVQISDLVFTLRLSALITFQDEVEDYWIESQIPYEKDRPFIGGSGESYTVDFYIPARDHPYLIKALSSQSTGYANTLVSRTVRTWHDLLRADGRYGYISLVDDAVDVWQEAWFDQLAEFSTVVVWSERTRLLDLVGSKARSDQRTFT